MTSLRDTNLTMLDGSTTTLGELAGDRAVLVVNVASKCGLTPQYAGLEEIAREYQDRGLLVVGAPCNQFGGQEPGTNEEIAEFCSTTYGVTFPLMDKLEVNGEGQHPLFAQLTTIKDAEGHYVYANPEAERIFGRPSIPAHLFEQELSPASVEESQTKFLNRFRMIDQGVEQDTQRSEEAS